MFCPKINSSCQYEDCPYYLPMEQDYCLDVLFEKQDLNILSNKEKQALSKIRQRNMRPIEYLSKLPY